MKHRSLEEALLEFRHAMTSALVEQAKAKGCSLAHFEVLKYIAEEGSPYMKDIAKRLHITPPSASTLIDALVKQGLVHRAQMPEDRRDGPRDAPAESPRFSLFHPQAQGIDLQQDAFEIECGRQERS
ncbi:MAG: MarR family transcriptional regulator [bacterium]